MKEYIKPDILDEIIEIEDIIAKSLGEEDEGFINDNDGFGID